MAVVADDDADAADRCVEHGVAEVAGLEEVLLPEDRADLRDVCLAVLAEVRAVGVDHHGGVVVDALHRLFVDRQDEHDAELLRELRHHRDGRTGLGVLRRAEPLGVALVGAEVGTVEDLLQAHDLRAL